MTGFRLGYACGPAELIEAMMKIHQYTMLCASSLSQKAALEALARPATDIGEMVDEYRRRRNVVAAAFSDMGLACHRPLGAFYAFPSVAKFGLPSRDFALRLLSEERVAVVPGSAFGACGEGFVRCAYATSMDHLEEAMVRLGKFVRRLKIK
jgi:aminotransferase